MPSVNDSGSTRVQWYVEVSLNKDGHRWTEIRQCNKPDETMGTLTGAARDLQSSSLGEAYKYINNVTRRVTNYWKKEITVSRRRSRIFTSEGFKKALQKNVGQG